jgi:predicted nucleic acid-binding protein
MPRPTFVTTGRVARNELNALAEDVRSLEQAGALRVEDIYKGSPEAKRAKELRDNEGADRGEAELLAWATSDPARREYRFISCDKEARKLAKSLGLATGDVLDLGIHWLRRSLVSLDALDEAFASWEDAHPGELWRPRDFTTTKETIRARLAAAHR